MISTQNQAKWLQLLNLIKQGLQAWIRREIIDFDPYDLEARCEQRLLKEARL